MGLQVFPPGGGKPRAAESVITSLFECFFGLGAKYPANHRMSNLPEKIGINTFHFHRVVDAVGGGGQQHKTSLTNACY